MKILHFHETKIMAASYPLDHHYEGNHYFDWLQGFESPLRPSSIFRKVGEWGWGFGTMDIGFVEVWRNSSVSVLLKTTKYRRDVEVGPVEHAGFLITGCSLQLALKPTCRQIYSAEYIPPLGRLKKVPD